MPTITLSDGRRIGYEDKGSGHVILFFHGQPGNRLFRPPDVDGYRVISIDRCGYGLSDYMPDFTVLGWADDVRQLADALDVDQFAVVGHSAGGPFALACAHQIPDRLTGCALVASAGPVYLQDVPMTALLRTNKILQPIKPLWIAGFNFFWWMSRRNPKAFVEAANKIGHASDRALSDVVQPMLHAVWNENLRVPVDGYRDEAGLLVRDWEFDFADVTMPVQVWHSPADTMAPFVWGKIFAEKLPNGVLHQVPEQGHFAILWNYWNEIGASVVR